MEDNGIIFAFIMVIVLITLGFGMKIQEIENEKRILEISCDGISLVGNVTMVGIENQELILHDELGQLLDCTVYINGSELCIDSITGQRNDLLVEVDER